MKILISADMEGATGVTWPEDVRPGTAEWQRFRHLLTGDVNAAIAGFFDGGASDVLVNEAHSTMRNVLLEELDARASMLTGRHKGRSMMEGIDADVGGVAFVGYHAGAGMDGILSHTYLPSQFTGVWLNGTRASEGRLNAAVAGEVGVPVVLVTGDDLTCKDAEDYAPAAKLVPVKDCVTRYAAICRPPSRTGQEIRSAAKEAMAVAGRTKSVKGGPWRIEIEFDTAHLPAAAAVVPGVEITGERRVAYESPTMFDAMRCFKAVASLTFAAMERDYG